MLSLVSIVLALLFDCSGFLVAVALVRCLCGAAFTMRVSANKHIELIMPQINIKYQSNVVVTVAAGCVLNCCCRLRFVHSTK
jgi:DNA-directed RNA polymerase beta' subunit